MWFGVLIYKSNKLNRDFSYKNNKACLVLDSRGTNENKNKWNKRRRDRGHHLAMLVADIFCNMWLLVSTICINIRFKKIICICTAKQCRKVCNGLHFYLFLEFVHTNVIFSENMYFHIFYTNFHLYEEAVYL